MHIFPFIDSKMGLTSLGPELREALAAPRVDLGHLIKLQQNFFGSAKVQMIRSQINQGVTESNGFERSGSLLFFQGQRR